MNIQTILFVLCVSLFIYAGISLYRQYKETSGVFFLTFIIFLLFWIFIATASYDSSFGKEKLVILNQLGYSVSICFFISITLFFSLFKSDSILVKQVFTGFLFLSILLISIFVSTDFIVADVQINRETGIYREIYGRYFVFVQLFFGVIPFILGLASFLTIKKQEYITKIRLVWIILGFLFTSIIAILFLIILPLLDVYFYEGEIIYFFIPFLFGVIYSSSTYIFSSFRGILTKILFFFVSIFLSAGGVIATENIASTLGLVKNHALGVNDISIYEVVLYSFILIFISRYVDGRSKIGNNFIMALNEIQEQVPFSTTLNDLNFLLETEFSKRLGIKFVKIYLFSTSLNVFSFSLKEFFSGKKSRSFFLNEKVFIKENFKNSDRLLDTQELSKQNYLIIPLRKKEVLVGYISFGKRVFESYYTKEEVEAFERFTSFLEGHLKYIDIYSEIHDLNLNLEKRVDEKTMQYNAIINRQKEFIEVVSHEVRTPLATALFQTECLEYELKEGVFPKKRKMIADVKALYNKITDTVSLVNKLFSIERFESNKITLYKENTDIGKMLKTQVQPYIKSHKEIEFYYEQGKDVGYLDIDIVQFKQVIDNLITNAIKFSAKVEHPKISIKLVKKKNDIVFTIEDSGLGFSGVDIGSLFEKYNTGDSSSIGLGMGLYLCKKIVELHGGNISAGKSKTLGGALFKIVLPKK